MSVRTTETGLKVTHSGVEPPSVMPAVAAWSYGSWVQIIASTAAPTTIAGIYLGDSSFSARVIEWQLGIGGPGSETAIHTWRTYGPNSANIAAPVYLWPVPFGGITAGSRLSLRIRTDTGSGSFTAGLLYYENFDSAHVALSTTLTGSQIGTALVSVTPSGTAWASSAWVELISSTVNEIAILGLTATASTLADVEWELGSGSSGAEVIRTTVRSPVLSASTGVFRSLWFPAPFPVPPSTRVAARMRKSDTATTSHGVSLVYVDPTSLLT